MPPELKQYMLVLAWAPNKCPHPAFLHLGLVWAPKAATRKLLGGLGLVLRDMFVHDSTASLDAAIYALSHGICGSVKDIRFLSRRMYKLMDSNYARLSALRFLNHIFGMTDELELFVRRHNYLLSYMDELPIGWRDAKIVIYACPHDRVRKDVDVFNGIMYAFDFNDDCGNPTGISRDEVTEIRYKSRVTHPFLAYTNTDALLSSRDVKVFAAVVNVTYTRCHDDQVWRFVHRSPIDGHPHTVCISENPVMEMHLCDVWNDDSTATCAH